MAISVTQPGLRALANRGGYPNAPPQQLSFGRGQSLKGRANNVNGSLHTRTQSLGGFSGVGGYDPLGGSCRTIMEVPNAKYGTRAGGSMRPCVYGRPITAPTSLLGSPAPSAAGSVAGSRASSFVAKPMSDTYPTTMNNKSVDKLSSSTISLGNQQPSSTNVRTVVNGSRYQPARRVAAPRSAQQYTKYPQVMTNSRSQGQVTTYKTSSRAVPSRPEATYAMPPGVVSSSYVEGSMRVVTSHAAVSKFQGSHIYRGSPRLLGAPVAKEVQQIKPGPRPTIEKSIAKDKASPRVAKVAEADKMKEDDIEPPFQLRPSVGTWLGVLGPARDSGGSEENGGDGDGPWSKKPSVGTWLQPGSEDPTKDAEAKSPAKTNVAGGSSPDKTSVQSRVQARLAAAGFSPADSAKGSSSEEKDACIMRLQAELELKDQLIAQLEARVQSACF